MTAFGTAVAWLTVMFLAAPETEATLERFYLRARPGGPGWRRQRERTGEAQLQDLGTDVLSAVLGILVIFGAMFALGGALFLRWSTALPAAAIAAAAGVLLWRTRRTAAMERGTR